MDAWMLAQRGSFAHAAGLPAQQEDGRDYIHDVNLERATGALVKMIDAVNPSWPAGCRCR